MPILSLEQTKELLALENIYTTDEHRQLTTAGQRLATKSTAIYIWRVSKDTDHDTGTTNVTTADYYTTKDNPGYTVIKKRSTSTIPSSDTVYFSYSYNQYNKQINNLIYKVQDDICNYCQNYFQDSNTYILATDLKIRGRTTYTTATDTYCITDSQSRFTTAGFLPNIDIVIEGSARNNGIYYVTSRQSSKLFLDNKKEITDETTSKYTGNAIKVSRVRWPEDLKPVAAKMIWQNIEKSKGNNIQSKSLGPSNVTYVTVGSGGYSNDILSALDKYKLTKCH